MGIKQIFPIILQVLKDFRVIGTVIAMILVISFAKFITTYKKKPKNKNKKGKKPENKTPKPQPETSQESDE